LGIERFASGREPRGVRASVHQICARPRFKRLNTPRKSGLRDVAQLRRTAETVCFSETDKVFKPFCFHALNYGRCCYTANFAFTLHTILKEAVKALMEIAQR
jgi:hypothetical protein